MKKINTLVLALMLFSLFSMAYVSAEEIMVSPYDNLELPQISSNVSLDKTGLQRTYLYCSWRIDGTGEEVVEMDSLMCPATKQTFNHIQENEKYYARIDYAKVGWSEINREWEVIGTGKVTDLENDYILDIPEPDQSFFDGIYNRIIGTVKSILCSLFGWCN